MGAFPSLSPGKAARVRVRRLNATLARPRPNAGQGVATGRAGARTCHNHDGAPGSRAAAPRSGTACSRFRSTQAPQGGQHRPPKGVNHRPGSGHKLLAGQKPPAGQEPHAGGQVGVNSTAPAPRGAEAAGNPV
jgi:hypothetical protein